MCHMVLLVSCLHAAHAAIILRACMFVLKDASRCFQRAKLWLITAMRHSCHFYSQVPPAAPTDAPTAAPTEAPTDVRSIRTGAMLPLLTARRLHFGSWGRLSSQALSVTDGVCYFLTSALRCCCMQAPTAAPTPAPVCTVDAVTTCSSDADCMVQPGTHAVCAPRIGSPGSACVPDVCCAQYVTADNTCGSDADCPCDRTCVTSICGTSGGFCAPIAGAWNIA